MKKGIILLIVGLVAGGATGYFYHAYQFRTQLEEARNFEAKQVLDNIVYGDVTSDVQITCNFGNKKTISGVNSGLKFAKNDFDADGNFVNHDKNAAIQKICEITKNEINTFLSQFEDGGSGNAEKLFEVTLSK